MPEETTAPSAVMDAPSGPPSGDRQSTVVTSDDGGFTTNDLWSGKVDSAPPVEKETAPEPQQQQEVEPPAEPAKAAKPENPRLAELMAEHARKLGFDINDPKHQGVLKQLADKDLFIEQLQAQAKTTAGEPAQAEIVPDQLTEFERELFGQSEEPAGEQKTGDQTADAATAQPGALPKFGDIGDEWKSEEDAAKAEEKAWASGDYKSLAAIRNAVAARQLVAMAPGLIMSMISRPEIANAIVQTALGKEFVGDIVPELRTAVESRRTTEDASFVVDQLAGNEHYRHIRDLFKPEGDKPLTFEGQKVPNNALNRIMVENPWIFDISAPPALQQQDPRVAAKVAMANRYRAALKIYDQEQATKNSIDPSKAKDLVQAGIATANRTEADRTRSGLNGGSGATTAGGARPARDSYVREIQRERRGGSLSLNDL